MFAVEFKDKVINGRSAVEVVVRGVDMDAPITDAAIVALAVKRLWDDGTLLPVTKHVCADVIAARRDAA